MRRSPRSARSSAPRLAAALALAIAAAPAGGAAPPEAELVSFPGPGGEHRGFLYRPAGEGPFPAILWNHGSEKRPGSQPALAGFFTARGYVFFLPHRAGQGRSPGTYIMDAVNASRGIPGRERVVVEAHERANLEVAAAGEWLRSRPFVAADSVAMIGCSFGGIQTLLSAERGLGFRAFVAFAPAARSWGNLALQDRLMRAVAGARGPVLILQAANDFSTEPTRVLGPVAERNGGRARVYPRFGASPEEGHWAFATEERGTVVWGDEVLKFLRAHLPPRPR